MTSTESNGGVIEFHECNICGYRITRSLYLMTTYDYKCPFCGGQYVSEFKEILGTTAA